MVGLETVVFVDIIILITGSTVLRKSLYASCESIDRKSNTTHQRFCETVNLEFKQVATLDSRQNDDTTKIRSVCGKVLP